MRYTPIVAVCLLLAACTDADPEGSRSPTGPTAVVPPVTAPTTPGPIAPAPSVPTTPLPTTANAVMLEDQVLVLVNQHRARGATCGSAQRPPVAPLPMHETLRQVARAHSQDMLARTFFSHTNPDGLSPSDRVRRAGYPFPNAGENIATGPGSAHSVVALWMGSPGHCENIMRATYRQIGVGFAGGYWTQVFTLQ